MSAVDEAREALLRLHERGDHMEDGWVPSDDGFECRACGNWCDAPAKVDAFEAAVRVERGGLVGALSTYGQHLDDCNVYGGHAPSAGCDCGLDATFARLEGHAEASPATPPAPEAEPVDKPTGSAPEPKPQHGPWGNEGYCYCGTFVGHGDDRWGQHWEYVAIGRYLSLAPEPKP